MSVRYELIKQSAQGESIGLVITQHNPVTGDEDHTIDQMADLLRNGINVCEERMIEMNKRIFEARKLHTFFDDQTWQRINTLLSVLEGRMTADHVARLWTSEAEETAMLEQLRATAALESENGVAYAEAE